MFNATEQHAWNKVCSTYQSDAGNNVTSRRNIGDGVFEFTCCTDIVSLFSMAPLGRIALDIEQMRISQATREIQKHPQLKIVGAHVDCVYFLKPLCEESYTLDRLTETHRFPNGESMFHIKNDPPCKVPTWPIKELTKRQPMTFEKPKWVRLMENDLKNLAGDLVDRFLEHKGLLLTGPAGVGKTYLVHELLYQLRQRFPEQKQIICALRHCAAMLVGGKTIQHYICKYKGRGSLRPFEKEKRSMLDAFTPSPL
jgi:hypothetical protein